MTSEIKLDVVNGHDESEPTFNSDGKALLVDRINGMHRVQDNFLSEDDCSISNLPNSEYKAPSDRSRKGYLSGLGSRPGLLFNGNGKRENEPRRKSFPLISGSAYCLSSFAMILLNKIVLSTYGFNAGISLMFYQNFISTATIVILDFCGIVSVEKPNWKLVKLWIPVILIFVGMLVSGMYSLKFINIAMVTILKNLTNILTAIGEFYLFHKHQNYKVWTAMFLMIISAISGGITDLSFDGIGYAWQFFNCILTASYSLILRLNMDKAKQLTKSGTLNEVSMVLLNNMLSLPFGIILILLFDEWHYVVNSEVIRIPVFWVIATVSGFLGLAISFTSMWFLNQTSPTSYSLVGSLNKIPISIGGLIFFKVPLSLSNFFSILFGLFAGIFFAKAKMR